MWSELFLENRDNLINEIDSIVNNLVQYKEAMENNDREKLTGLLREGKILKEQIDG
jgi:prephenate dehydrogenase